MLTSSYNGYPVHLIESVEELQEIRNLLVTQVNVGVDTETTGLDYNKDVVVGVCISCGQGYSQEQYHGFYIPIRHQNYNKNLPIKDVVRFTQWIVDSYKSCWWNRNYDFSMLEKDGFVAPFVGKTHDAQIMAHLINQEPFPALKETAANLLKFEVIEFSANNAKDNNFGTTDPTTTYRYAAQDPVVTTLLARKIWTDYPYIRKIYPVDNKSAEAIRKFSMTTELFLDHDLLNTLKEQNNAELAKTKQEIFTMVGYQFKLNSNRDKGDALSRFVTLTKRTKSGQFDVSKEVLAEIDHPLAKLLSKYATLEKFRSSYLEKMSQFPNPFRANYHTIDVPTGRLASGASKGNPYFAPINIQNIPKIEIFKYLHKGGVLGYYADYNKENAIGKIKCKGGLRDTFVSPEGYVWISADYSAQEVRVLAIMSNEQVLIEPILNGDDIHKFVATKMFGHYDPSHRTIAKTITFAANYGGSGYTIAKRLGLSQQEGDALLQKYNQTLANATRWKQETQKDARRKGIVFTYFGRPRCVWKYYNSSDRSMQAFGDRTAINSPIQGFGGDLIRIDHIKLWQKFLDDEEFAANVKYACTVHDEINLFVKPNYLKKAMDTLTSIMNFQPESFPIPISVSPSAGLGWGDQIEGVITDDNKISLPEYDGIPEQELIEKFKSENPELYA